MLKARQKFTPNKQVVRDLQCESLLKHLSARRGLLRYFGLPSTALDDVRQWSPLLCSITAVERGSSGGEWRSQNELLVNAFLSGLTSKLKLLRGDIDQILITGKDDFKSEPSWPFDVVSLDYSGGLFYRNGEGEFTRLEALRHVFARQNQANANNFVFLLSFNLDAIDQGEVRSRIKMIHRDLRRFGASADNIIEQYLKHPKDQCRLKLYVVHLVNNLAIQSHFDSYPELPIFYSGNKGTEMMAFRFYLKTVSSRAFGVSSPKERLNQTVNRPAIEIVDGRQRTTNFGLPLLKASTETTEQ